MMGIIQKIWLKSRKNQKTEAVLIMARMNAIAKVGRRPMRCVTKLKEYMPAKAPKFSIIEVIPAHLVVAPETSAGDMPCAANVLLRTERIKSMLKKPMPHKPTTPEKASSTPMMAFFRQR